MKTKLSSRSERRTSSDYFLFESPRFISFQNAHSLEYSLITTDVGVLICRNQSWLMIVAWLFVAWPDSAVELLHFQLVSSFAEILTAVELFHFQIESRFAEIVVAVELLHFQLASRFAEIVTAVEMFHFQLESSFAGVAWGLLAAQQLVPHERLPSNVQFE